MELSALRAPHPTVPSLQQSGDKRVHSILRDLDKIKNSKKKKQVKRCDFLINYIAQSLRKCPNDHLLHTTSIWVLITIFRLFPEATKDIMIAAGIPGRLFEIIKSGGLNGSTRQYASELCFYLSTNHPYPGDAWQSGEPMSALPEVQMANRYRPDLDDVTMVSDVSSVVNERPTRHPFVPYRIDDHNMAKMEALFEQGYHHQVAASLPNHLLLSKYGFSTQPSDQNESDSDDAEEKSGDEGSDESDLDDEDSAVSTISSASRSVSIQSLGGSLPNSSRRLDLQTSQSLFQQMHTGRLRLDDDLASSTSSALNSARSLGYAHNLAAEAEGRRPKTTAFPISPFGLGKLRRDSDASHYQNNQPPTSSHLVDKQPGNKSARSDDSSVVHRPYLFPLDSSAIRTSSQQHPHSARSQHSSSSHNTPHRMVHQLRSSHRHGHQSHGYQSHSAGGAMDFSSGANVSKEPGIFSDWIAPHRISKSAATGSKAPISRSFFADERDSSFAPLESAGIDAYFSALDPLALSVKSTLQSAMKPQESSGIENINGGWDLDTDDDDDLDGVQHGGKLDEVDDEEDEDLKDIANEFILKKRLRMRAEKLIDHSFVQKLFVKKATMQDAQDLIRRMENLFDMLDPEKSGYVTFESFTRLILAIAPPKVLRSDILNFINAQTKRMDDLVDYNEFIISGKVLLLTKAQRSQAIQDREKLQHLPKGAKEAFAYRNETASTMVWLKRQKNYVGEESTLTWKNHLKWYQRRKAQALIWLVRRATRSLKHEVVLDEAKRFLLVKAKQAKAMSDLIDIGRASLKTLFKGGIAKRRLLKRAMHARRFMIKVMEAQEYLRGFALTAIKDLEYMDRVRALKQEKEEIKIEEARKALEKKTQANYANLFKVKALQTLSVKDLAQRAKKAWVHCAKQDEAIDFIRAVVRKAQKQLALKDKARRDLVLRVEAAFAFCLNQDQCLLRLMRLGELALRHMDRQEETLKWLIKRGQDSLVFLAGKFTASLELAKIGQHTLKYMNRREASFAYLNQRRIKSTKFVIAKKEAIEFLRTRPNGVWKVIDNSNEAQAWLSARANRAKVFYAAKFKAAQYLQHIAAKAASTFRRSHIAFQELTQIGMHAKLESFKLMCQNSSALQRIVQTEKTRTLKMDAKQQKSRATWTVEERIKWEMAELFQILTSVYTPAHLAVKKPLKQLDALLSSEKDDTMEDDHHLMGIYAFRIMVNRGRLFHIPSEEVEEFFRNTDVSRSGYIDFESMLPWLRKKALKVKNFRSKISDILSAEERSYITCWLRMQRDKNFIKTATDLNKYEEMKAKKRAKKKEDEFNEWSDDDEDEAEDDMDEDALMADLDKLRNMDVGRLMRYLTRKREAQQQALVDAASAANGGSRPGTASGAARTSSRPGTAADASRPNTAVTTESKKVDPVQAIIDEVLSNDAAAAASRPGSPEHPPAAPT